MQTQSERREDELNALNDQQIKTTAEIARLPTQIENKMTKAVDSKYGVAKSEQSSKHAEIVCGTEDSIGAPSTAASSELPAKCVEFENRYKASMLENQ